MSYHLCARQIGQCVGLGRGIKGYHLCARNANCKKKDRQKVEKVASKIKKSKAKQIIKKAVEGSLLKGNRREEAIKEVRDLMKIIIKMGSTKYMYNLIKNEKDLDTVTTLLYTNEDTYNDLVKDTTTILFKLMHEKDGGNYIEQIGTDLFNNFNENVKLYKSRVKQTIEKKYYKNR